MTPSERLLKAVHMELDRRAAFVDALSPSDVHQYVMRVKPRGDGWRVSLQVEAQEERA